tara:strand:+ start:82 stop:315 length:234 start_codon:yes stop_codon:yes gene_type:complete
MVELIYIVEFIHSPNWLQEMLRKIFLLIYGLLHIKCYTLLTSGIPDDEESGYALVLTLLISYVIWIFFWFISLLDRD